MNPLLKHNSQVPRYTSYPTAPHFQPLAADDAATSLAALPADKPVSLYIHIPYCREMCWYCGCHTTATRKYAPVEDYVSLLCREVAITAETIGQRLSAAHLHFGGGSPTMLQPEDFSRIMEALRRHVDFTPDAEISLEADPRNFTHDKAEAYAREGVNRLSFGIQDFAPEVQRAINRPQSPAVVEQAVERARGFNINRINFDLMYGLPLQTLAHVEETALTSLRMGPDRIALFGYAHVPWMKKHMRLIREEDLPDAAARLAQFARADELLQSAGLVPVGIDHFVRASDDMHKALRQKTLARNFQGYTTDSAPTLIGFGMSSISRLPGGYAQNFSNLTEYTAAILATRLPAARGYSLTADDRLRQDIISDIMCYLEADIPALLQRHGRARDDFDDILAALSDLAADGLVSCENGIIRAPQGYRQAARLVAARFDAHLSPQNNRHAQAA